MSLAVLGAGCLATGMALQLAPRADEQRSGPSLMRLLSAIVAALVGFGVAWIANNTVVFSGTAPASNMDLAFIGLLGMAAGLASAAALESSRIAPTALSAALGASLCSALLWMMRFGWLRAIGSDASLGHGAVDLTGVALLGLTVGGGLLGSRLKGAPQQHNSADWLQHKSLPVVLSTLLVCLGTVLNAHGLQRDGSALLTAQALGLLLAAGAAGAASLAYGWFTTARFDLRFGARGLLAAALCSSSIALLPLAFALPLGLFAAFCALPGAYWLRAWLGVRDPHGAIGTYAAPALAGTLIVGLFANGRFLAGWNDVGADSYLNSAGLGVVGWLHSGDVGQFSAQIVLAIAIGASACAASALLFEAAVRLAPGMMLERNVHTTVAAAQPQPRVSQAGEDTLDGESLDKPRRTLPQTRAYRVAYPFKNRSRHKSAPEFVVRDDDQADSSAHQR
jgi:ammonia channel protein AmtB